MLRKPEKDCKSHRSKAGRYDVYQPDTYNKCGGSKSRGQGKTFYENGRNDHKCTGNLSGDILCGLRTTVFCRSCKKSDRTVAFGLERNGWKDRKSNSGTDAKTYGSDPKDILAAIGPSICQDCYEVSEDVIVKFQKSFEEKYWPELFYQKENGKYQLNLWKANELVFEEAGILKKHIAVTNVCTHCNPDILFSHRTTGNKRGNLSAFLALK